MFPIYANLDCLAAYISADSVLRTHMPGMQYVHDVQTMPGMPNVLQPAGISGIWHMSVCQMLKKLSFLYHLDFLSNHPGLARSQINIEQKEAGPVKFHIRATTVP